MRFLITCVLYATLFSALHIPNATEAQQIVTLGSLRKQYSGQTVIVLGSSVTLGGRNNLLLEWYIASPDGSRYKAGVFDNLPDTYKGQTAKVIAVQINELKLKLQTTNALGEPITEDGVANPYVDIVIQFEDGQLAMTTNYSTGLEEAIELASIQHAEDDEMTTGLPQLIGRSLYAAGFSVRYQPLFQPETALDEMLKVTVVNDALLYLGDGQISVSDVPLLEPLKIIAAKYIPAQRGVVLKLELPGGNEAVTFVNHIHLKKQLESRQTCTHSPCPMEEMSLFERVAGSYLTSIPPKLTVHEIAAIRKSGLFVGMSKMAVEYGWGFLPEKQNDWGRGGTQMIFGDSVYVYVDSQDKVVNWQFLNQ